MLIKGCARHVSGQLKMKKTLTMIVALAMGVAVANAQNSFNTPVADETMGAETIEMAEAIPVDMSQPMQITDASFADEQAVQTLLADYVDNPKQTTAAILNILLGDLGVGHFYTGQTLRGVLDIIFCWTGIPAIIGIVEGIIWLTDTEEEWAARVAGWRNK